MELSTEKTIFEVAKVLENHIYDSVNKKTFALNQIEPELIAKKLKLKERLNSGFKSSEDIIDFLKNYLENTNHLNHPHYMGHQVAVPQELSGIPELIHGTINNPSSLYEMGPAGSTCEGFMINWMLNKLGWLKNKDFYDFKFKPGQPSGVLTHGGSIANLTALTAARSKISPDSWDIGNPSNLVVIGSASAHYSIVRSLSILGLGRKSFIAVPVDKNEVIKIDQLKKIYNQTVDDGKKVMCIVANACATSTGLFEPLELIGDFCKKHSIWFHVDGAHGAAALVSKKNKGIVKGIDKATSLIWDAHKMMRVPSLCTAILFNDFKLQAGAFQQKGSYVFHNNEVVGMDSMPYTVECTKSALGTKLFWAFAIKGEKAIEDYIDYTFSLCKDFYFLLNKDSEFEVPYNPQSNILCFRYVKYSINDEFQLKLRYKIINNKHFYITSCEMNNLRYLRVVLLNPRTNIGHLKDLITEIKKNADILANQ